MAKTNLFSTHRYKLDGEFPKDIKKLEKLSLEKKLLLPEYTLKVFSTGSKIEENNLIKKAVAELEVPESLFLDLRVLTLHFLNNLSKDEVGEKDSAIDLAHDLAELNYIESSSVDDFIKFFQEVRNIASSDFEKSKEIRKTEIISLPNVTSITNSSNLRAVIKSRYKGEVTSDEYSPNISSFVPVATIELSLTDSSTTDKKVHFQVNKKSVDHLINHLKAVQKELLALEKISKGI